MFVQFFVAFVGRVDRVKEGFRVTRVNGYRDAETSGLFPDRIDAGIVDRNQLASLVANSETKVFEYFQATCPARNRIVELLHHFRAEVRIVDFAPVDLSENDEPAGIRLYHLVDDGLQLVAPHASQDDDGLYIASVHDLDDALGRHVLVDPRGVVHVAVHVDHVILGLVDGMHRDVQHRSWLEIFEEKGLRLIGIGSRLVADLGLRLSGRGYEPALPQATRRIESQKWVSWISS